ncbi:choice-of-anchor P family protein [Parafrankia discariae]|uniref:choice-of-anchor P family protein n=1 Tax=Parafrankia discariae TaxID=365528 RepID=UPI00036F2BA0|nr:choice-of-anchor P family protein [Parafrankia discariae]
MRKLAQRTARCLGVLAVAGGVALATTTPATAAAPNIAVGLRASGAVPSGPAVVSTFPGTPQNHRVGLSIPSLISVGVIDTAAGPTSASATVGGVSAGLSGVATVSVDSIRSGCVYNPSTGTVTGSTAITNARIALLGIPVLIQPNPAPDTTIALPGGLGTLLLNHQTLTPDGTLTVDAVSVSLLGGLESAVVATSVCNKAALS